MAVPLKTITKRPILKHPRENGICRKRIQGAQTLKLPKVQKSVNEYCLKIFQKNFDLSFSDLGRNLCRIFVTLKRVERQISEPQKHGIESTCTGCPCFVSRATVRDTVDDICLTFCFDFL